MATQIEKIIPRTMNGGARWRNPGWPLPGIIFVQKNALPIPPCIPDEIPELRDVIRNIAFLFRVTSIVGHRVEADECTTSVESAADSDGVARTGYTGRQGGGSGTSQSVYGTGATLRMNANSLCKCSFKPSAGPSLWYRSRALIGVVGNNSV